MVLRRRWLRMIDTLASVGLTVRSSTWMSVGRHIDSGY